MKLHHHHHHHHHVCRLQVYIILLNSAPHSSQQQQQQQSSVRQQIFKTVPETVYRTVFWSRAAIPGVISGGYISPPVLRTAQGALPPRALEF